MQKVFFYRTAGLMLLMNILLCRLHAQSAVLSVQGVLRKNDGKAVDDGTYTLKFRLWKHQTSTNNADKVWEDSFTDVEIAGGVYNVLLGTGSKPLDAPFDQTYYLGISMSSGPELQPRPMLTSAPFVLSLQGQSNILPSAGPMGIGTARPDTTSALVAVQSATQGMLIPRMTQAQRNAIAAPAAGLLVFQTNNDPGFYFHNGTAWQAISTFSATALSLGAFHEGGYIIYLDATGQHGLVAAPADITSSPSISALNVWSWSDDPFDDERGETAGTTVGSGQANTASLMRAATDKSDYRAAYVCAEYVSADGYSDWFLPSKDELNLIYTVLKLQGITTFANANYWSSTQPSDENEMAWQIDFTNGTASMMNKGANNRVRPVRAF